MSSYLTDPTSSITLDSNGDSVQVEFVSGRGGDCTAVKSGSNYVAMKVINAATFKLGVGGPITVSNAPSGSQPQIVFQVNGNNQGAIDLSSGLNSLNYNGVFIAAQSYNSGDTFTMWCSGGAGTSFSFGHNGSEYVSFLAVEQS